MNLARFSVGIEGVAIAERASQRAVAVPEVVAAAGSVPAGRRCRVRDLSAPTAGVTAQTWSPRCEPRAVVVAASSEEWAGAPSSGGDERRRKSRRIRWWWDAASGSRPRAKRPPVRRSPGPRRDEIGRRDRRGSCRPGSVPLPSRRSATRALPTAPRSAPTPTRNAPRDRGDRPSGTRHRTRYRNRVALRRRLRGWWRIWARMFRASPL